MLSENDLNKIKRMSSITVEKRGLNKARLVTIKKDRKCFCCGKIIQKGSKAITASHMIDKKKNVMLKDLLNDDVLYTRDYRFVPERHWVCETCVKESLNIRVKEDYFDFELIDLNEYSYDKQLELIAKAYDYGQISGEEYDNLEKVIIDAIALEEAVGIGQS